MGAVTASAPAAASADCAATAAAAAVDTVTASLLRRRAENSCSANRIACVEEGEPQVLNISIGC